MPRLYKATVFIAPKDKKKQRKNIAINMTRRKKLILSCNFCIFKTFKTDIIGMLKNLIEFIKIRNWAITADVFHVLPNNITNIYSEKTAIKITGKIIIFEKIFKKSMVVLSNNFDSDFLKLEIFE